MNKTYQFKNARLSYEIIGRGKPIILLHGTITNNPWKGFEKKLAEFYQVYLPSLPGFGSSEAVKGELHNTHLFTEALCVFFKKTNLQEVPIISFSLGTIIAIKTAAKKHTRGKLILVGMPGKLAGWKFEIARRFPIPLRRILASTVFGKKKLLIPILRANIGEINQDRNEDLLRALTATNPCSLVDVDIRKEIDRELPIAFYKVKNEMMFIYGEKDKLKNTTTHLIKDYIEIPEAGHNIFRSQPQKSLKILRQILSALS